MLFFFFLMCLWLVIMVTIVDMYTDSKNRLLHQAFEPLLKIESGGVSMIQSYFQSWFKQKKPFGFPGISIAASCWNEVLNKTVEKCNLTAWLTTTNLPPIWLFMLISRVYSATLFFSYETLLGSRHSLKLSGKHF